MKKPSTISIRNIVFALAATLSLALLPTAQAQVEVSDNFSSYSAGAIAPQNGNGANNGGIGWAQPNLTGDYGDSAGANPWSSAAWQNYTTTPWLSGSVPLVNSKNPAITVVTTPTLSYTDGSGNTFNASGNAVGVINQSAERYYSTAGINAFEAGTAGSPTTLWASFLFQPTATPNKTFVLPFLNTSVNGPGTNVQDGAGVLLYENTGFTTWVAGLQIRGASYGGTEPATTLALDGVGKTSLIVMEFINNGGAGADKEYLWVDPTLGTTPGIGTAVSATGTLDAAGYFVLRGSSVPVGGGNDYIGDLSLGDTYGDVTPFTPAPEPSTLALSLIGGVMGLVVFRRRRANALNPRR